MRHYLVGIIYVIIYCRYLNFCAPNTGIYIFKQKIKLLHCAAVHYTVLSTVHYKYCVLAVQQ